VSPNVPLRKLPFAHAVCLCVSYNPYNTQQVPRLRLASSAAAAAAAAVRRTRGKSLRLFQRSDVLSHTSPVGFIFLVQFPTPSAVCLLFKPLKSSNFLPGFEARRIQKRRTIEVTGKALVKPRR